MMTLHCPPSSSGQVLWWQERRRTEGYCGRAGLPRCVRCATIRRGWTPALLQTVHGEAGLHVSGCARRHTLQCGFCVAHGCGCFLQLPQNCNSHSTPGCQRPSRLLFVRHDDCTNVSSAALIHGFVAVQLLAKCAHQATSEQERSAWLEDLRTIHVAEMTQLPSLTPGPRATPQATPQATPVLTVSTDAPAAAVPAIALADSPVGRYCLP